MIMNWISVEERLPEQGSHVLAAFKDASGALRVADTTFFIDEFLLETLNGVKSIEAVKWMPVPDPNVDETKVYVIQSGEYSDKSIDLVTDSKEKANGYLKILTEAYYEEWTLNKYDYEPFNCVDLWTCVFYKDGTHLLNMVSDTWSLIEPDAEGNFTVRTNGDSMLIKPNVVEENDDIMWVAVKAKDKEHAFKIACDLRAKYLAEKNQIS